MEIFYTILRLRINKLINKIFFYVTSVTCHSQKFSVTWLSKQIYLKVIPNKQIVFPKFIKFSQWRERILKLNSSN